MSEKKIEEIAENADMIINNYAFTRKDGKAFNRVDSAEHTKRQIKRTAMQRSITVC